MTSACSSITGGLVQINLAGNPYMTLHTITIKALHNKASTGSALTKLFAACDKVRGESETGELSCDIQSLGCGGRVKEHRMLLQCVFCIHWRWNLLPLLFLFFGWVVVMGHVVLVCSGASSGSKAMAGCDITGQLTAEKGAPILGTVSLSWLWDRVKEKKLNLNKGKLWVSNQHGPSTDRRSYVILHVTY